MHNCKITLFQQSWLCGHMFFQGYKISLKINLCVFSRTVLHQVKTEKKEENDWPKVSEHTCCKTSGLSQGRTLMLYLGKSWTTLSRCPWLIILRLLRKPERYTFPSTEMRIWLAFTLLKARKSEITYPRRNFKSSWHPSMCILYRS